MKQVHPAPIQKYRDIGGVMDICVFDEVKKRPDNNKFLEAIGGTIGSADFNLLLELGYRPTDKQSFYGAGYDMETKSLIKLGRWDVCDLKIADRQEKQRQKRTLVNPKIQELIGLTELGGSVDGNRKRFAAMFLDTPYGLHLELPEGESKYPHFQRIFDEVDSVIFPSGQAEILDWYSEKLAEASKYFLPGMEWWGVCLYTVYVPEAQRLTVIAGSATD